MGGACGIAERCSGPLSHMESPRAHHRPRNARQPDWRDASQMEPGPAPSSGRPWHRALAARPARLAVIPAVLEDLVHGHPHSRVILAALRQDLSLRPDGGIRIGVVQDPRSPLRAARGRADGMRGRCRPPFTLPKVSRCEFKRVRRPMEVCPRSACANIFQMQVAEIGAGSSP